MALDVLFLLRWQSKWASAVNNLREYGTLCGDSIFAVVRIHPPQAIS